MQRKGIYSSVPNRRRTGDMTSKKGIFLHQNESGKRIPHEHIRYKCICLYPVIYYHKDEYELSVVGM